MFVRFAADRFPHQKRHYIWFTDIGLASGIVQQQLAQDHVPAATCPMAPGSALATSRHT